MLVLLKRCQRKNIKLNQETFRLKKTEMFYMRMDKGYIPDPKKQDCIVTIPLPTNNDELRRLLGVAPNRSRFSEDFLTKSEPLRPLLKNNNACIWE